MSKVLLTPVDTLIELLKQEKTLSFSKLQERLKVPLEILEKWVIILEEYKIVKTFYKGFEGYAQYIEETKEQNKEEIEIDNLKEFFMEKCKKKHLDSEDMKKLWPKFIIKYELDIKQLFDVKAKQLGFNEQKIDVAWQKYKRDLETF
jgi:DNA-binding transcriptional regulator YhcF (GntR family)